MNLPTFKKHQYEFTAHIRDPEKNARPDGIEDRRMGIYRDLFYNNVEGFIASSFPVIREIYNEKNWHKMIRDFFAKHESHTPYFLEIAEEFLDYLQNERLPQEEDPAGLIELAHYEWVELALHVSDESINMDNINANGNLLKQRPVFHPLPGHWFISFQYILWGRIICRKKPLSKLLTWWFIATETIRCAFWKLIPSLLL